MIQKNFGVFTASAFLFPRVFFSPFLIASQENSNKPSKTEVIQKTKKLQIPLIANKGQTDEKVKFYANTFGGTVFVTKEGEIVYSLPNNEKTDTGELHSPSGNSPLERGDKGVCKTAPTFNDMKETHPRPRLLAGRTGIALREQFVGAKVKTIQGEDPSVTKVNYFKGNDISQWKTNISTYDVVSLGEVYDGIELKLKAYGNNIEKLFYVKPGADPEQIKISLRGIQPPESPLEKGARGLWVNEHDELVAETELGPVKFTKPVAYQEINGKRVDVECKYTVADCGMQNAECKTNLKSEIRNPNTVSPLHLTIKQKTSSSTPSWHPRF